MGTNAQQPVEELLDEIDSAANEHDPLTFGQMMDAIGRNSFSPLLVVIGLIMMLPGPADIPGVPSLLGLVVILLAAQMLWRHDHVWIPAWMENRKVKSKRVHKMISWMRRPAVWIDAITAPRWTWLMNHATVTVLAIAAIIVAMSTPLMELVPFTANLAGVAIAAFGLAILARDGLLAGLAILVSAGTFVLVFTQLMG